MKRLLATTLIAGLAAACNTIPPQPPNGAMAVDLPRTEFPGVNRMAAGFGARTEDHAWEADDEVQCRAATGLPRSPAARAATSARSLASSSAGARPDTS